MMATTVRMTLAIMLQDVIIHLLSVMMEMFVPRIAVILKSDVYIPLLM